jgi:heat-inducible transcriptional repressor
MVGAVELDKRKRDVLAALVYEFISTGEPAGSRTLSKKYGLGISPATVRTTMGELEELGLVHQPHTSAGRLPTDRGIRIFVDSLMELRALTDEERLSIQRRYGDLAVGGEGWSQLVRGLSELTQQPAVVCSPRSRGMVLRQLRFVPVGPGQVLALLVSAWGVTQSRLLRGAGNLTPAALDRIHNYLNELVPGRTLKEARKLIDHETKEAQRSLDQILLEGLRLGRDALGEDGDEPAMLVHGQAKLVQIGSGVDLERLRHLMDLLDDQHRLAALLDATIAAEGPLIFIGAEHPVTETASCSVIAASYSFGVEAWGTIAVIGPRSMDYARVIPLVGFTARILSEPTQE